jgi:putative NADH-flavin reductase
MKLAIIGANGKAGKLLVKEEVERGHEVTAIIRQDAPVHPKASVLVKDLFNLTYEDLEDNEVIIDAFGTWEPDTLFLHRTTLKYLADLLSGKPNRLLVVGSAGSLFVDSAHTMRVLDSPDIPEMFIPLSTVMTSAYDDLKLRTDLVWTYFSPAGFFDAAGLRTGEYRLGQDELLVNSKGESYLSYADGAIALIDEAENGKYRNQRFTAVSV